MYAKKRFSTWEKNINSTFCQVTGIGIQGQGGEASIYLVYRSPNSTQANDASLNEWLDSLTGDYWIFGDFNFPGIVWEESRSDVRGREFLETVESKFLGQHVTEATHFRGHILDLVMSSCENMVVGVEHQGRLGSSDHEILMCTLAADFLREDLTTQWSETEKIFRP